MHDSYHDFGLKGFLTEIWKSNVKNKAAGQTREKFLFLWMCY